VTWRDQDTLVIGENDARKIITSHDKGGLLCFFCGDADDTQYDVENGTPDKVSQFLPSPANHDFHSQVRIMISLPTHNGKTNWKRR